MKDKRFEAIYEAASTLFIKQGYQNTQVSEIAKEASIATGSVYNVFAGKKAILTFVIYHTLMDHTIEPTIPFDVIEDEKMIVRLNEIIGPFLSVIKEKDDANNPILSFEELLSKLFDLVAKYHKAFSLINDHKKELKNVEAVYRSYVNELYTVILHNLSIYKDNGTIRDIKYPELHIRNILEGITWWAMYVPYQDHPNQSITKEEAKKEALTIITKGYVNN